MYKATKHVGRLPFLETGLGQLAPEIRQQIFTQLLATPPPYAGRQIESGDRKPIIDLAASYLTVLGTCRQVYVEASPVFYCQKSYYIASVPCLERFLDLGHIMAESLMFCVDEITTLCVKDLVIYDPVYTPEELDDRFSGPDAHLYSHTTRAALEAESRINLHPQMSSTMLQDLSHLRKLCFCIRVGEEWEYLNVMFMLPGLDRGVIDFVDDSHWKMRAQNVEDDWKLQYACFPNGNCTWRKGKNGVKMSWDVLRNEEEVLRTAVMAPGLKSGDERFVEVDIGLRRYEERWPTIQDSETESDQESEDQARTSDEDNDNDNHSETDIEQTGEQSFSTHSVEEALDVAAKKDTDQSDMHFVSGPVIRDFGDAHGNADSEQAEQRLSLSHSEEDLCHTQRKAASVHLESLSLGLIPKTGVHNTNEAIGLIPQSEHLSDLLNHADDRTQSERNANQKEGRLLDTLSAKLGDGSIQTESEPRLRLKNLQRNIKEKKSHTQVGDSLQKPAGFLPSHNQEESTVKTNRTTVPSPGLQHRDYGDAQVQTAPIALTKNLSGEHHRATCYTRDGDYSKRGTALHLEEHDVEQRFAQTNTIPSIMAHNITASHPDKARPAELHPTSRKPSTPQRAKTGPTTVERRTLPRYVRVAAFVLTLGLLYVVFYIKPQNTLPRVLAIPLLSLLFFIAIST